MKKVDYITAFSLNSSNKGAQDEDIELEGGGQAWKKALDSLEKKSMLRD